MADFNLQDFLRDTRAEQREDYQRLADNVSHGFDKMSDAFLKHAAEDIHTAEILNGRLQNLEATDKTVRWLARTIFGGAIVMTYDMVKNHWHWI